MDNWTKQRKGTYFFNRGTVEERGRIAVRKGDKALAEKISAAILAIRANGKYKAIQDKYFSFDVYGK